MMSPNDEPPIFDCERPPERPSALAPPFTSTMIVLGRKIWPAIADALPRNTNRRVKSIRVLSGGLNVHRREDIKPVSRIRRTRTRQGHSSDRRREPGACSGPPTAAHPRERAASRAPPRQALKTCLTQRPIDSHRESRTPATTIAAASAGPPPTQRNVDRVRWRQTRGSRRGSRREA